MRNAQHATHTAAATGFTVGSRNHAGGCGAATIIDNANQTTTYRHDALGNLANVTGSGSISETMTYGVKP